MHALNEGEGPSPGPAIEAPKGDEDGFDWTLGALEVGTSNRFAPLTVDDEPDLDGDYEDSSNGMGLTPPPCPGNWTKVERRKRRGCPAGQKRGVLLAPKGAEHTHPGSRERWGRVDALA